MNKQTLFLLFFLFQTIFFYSQKGTAKHYKQAITFEALASKGKHNFGPGIKIGYFIKDDQQVSIGGIYRFFKYKEYQENIIEPNIEYAYTFYAPDRYNSAFRNFSFTAIGGAAVELVKIKSDMVLIEQDKYPKYAYVYLGLNNEFTLTEKLTLNLFARQFYALNGKKETLGNFRYDIGLSTRYYFY